MTFRVSVLCSQGKHFCAGADFSGDSNGNDTLGLYAGAVRIFRVNKPIIAAIGAAIGGGLGLTVKSPIFVLLLRSPIQHKLFSPGLSSGVWFERHLNLLEPKQVMICFSQVEE